MTFIKKYYEYISENMDLAKSIFKKKQDEFEKLKILLSKNLGYIGKFTEYLIEESIPYNELEKAYKDILEIKSKSYKIDINNLKYEKLIDKIQTTKEDIIIKEITNQFPSEQKNLIKELDEDDNYRKKEFRSLCLKVSKKENIRNFISKISRYKSLDDLISSMKVFSKSKDNSIESVKDLISKSKSKTIIEKEKVIIIIVPSFEEIQIFGSDTSWCIVSNYSQWEKYTKNRYQFVLYDYNFEEHDPKFKIGFTIDKYGSIYAAHDILDASCSPHLEKLLKSIDVKTMDLIPQLKPIDISAIKRNTKNEDLLEVFKRCTIAEIPTCIRSLLTWTNKSGTFMSSSILLLLRRFFNEKKFILESDLKSIDKNLPDYILRISNSINGKFIYPTFASQLSEEALEKGIEIWNDQEYLTAINDIISRYNDQIYEKYRFSLKKISDRLNKIYTDNKFGKMAGNLKSRLEVYMIIMNYKLIRGDDTPNHDNIIKSLPQWAIDDYAEILDIKLDLNNFSSIPDSIEQIIKKDYPEKRFIIYYHGFDTALFLVDYLDGYVLNLGISKGTIKDILGGRRRYYGSKEKKYDLKENNKLLGLIKQLSGKRKWAEVTDGKLSLRIEE